MLETILPALIREVESFDQEKITLVARDTGLARMKVYRMAKGETKPKINYIQTMIETGHLNLMAPKSGIEVFTLVRAASKHRNYDPNIDAALKALGV